MSRLSRLKSRSHGEDGKWAHDEIVRLRKQRDELLAALKVAIDTPELQGGKWEELARAAIANVKGDAV